MTFANRRPGAFTPADDWRKDVPAVAKWARDHFQWLEQPGALNITLPDLPNFNLVNVEDYVNPDATDHSIGLRAAAAALVAQGGGVLWLKPGKTYTVWTSDTTTIFDFTNDDNIYVMGNGAIIDSALIDTDSAAYLFDFTGSENVGIYNLNFTGGNTTCRLAGEHFIAAGTGTSNLTVENCNIKNCQVGVSLGGAGGTAAYNYGLVVENCYFEMVGYPTNVYSTHGIRCRYRAVNCGRAIVLGNSASNFEYDVDSRQGLGTSDIAIGIYADSGYSGTAAEIVAHNTIENGRINYRSIGMYASDQTVDVHGIVLFTLQQLDADSSAGHLRNIDINLCIDCGATNQFANAVLFQRYTSAGAGDTTSRVHTIRDLTISGTILNGGNLLQSGLQLFPVTTVGGSAQTWTGDLIENIAIRDFNIKGAPTTDAIYINGQGAVSGKRFVTFDNVEVDGTITLANAAGDEIEGLPIQFTPAITFGGAAAGPITYGVQTGSYVLRDGRCRGSIHITLTSNGTSAGTLLITGLPFTVRNNNDAYVPVAVRLDAVTYTGMVQGYCIVNTTTIGLEDLTEAGARAVLDDTNTADTSSFFIHFDYQIA